MPDLLDVFNSKGKQSVTIDLPVSRNAGREASHGRQSIQLE